MPSKRQRTKARAQISLADLSIAERLLLDGGPCRGWPGPVLTSIDVAGEVWNQFGTELTADFVARSPGCRPWAWWTFEALPHDPRRRVADDFELPATCADAPCGEAWQSSDGYESSYAYLTRRGLLGLDELASIRTRHDGQPILESHRNELERIAMPWRDNARMPGWELADLLSLFPEVELTAEELAAAAPFRPTNGHAH